MYKIASQKSKIAMKKNEYPREVTLKNNLINKLAPRFRKGQRVLAPINNIGNKVLCQINNLEWKKNHGSWAYYCRSENGHFLSAFENEIEAAGPKPVSDGFLRVVRMQEEAYVASIIAALEEALEERDANDLSVTVNGCRYDGIVKGPDGDLLTMIVQGEDRDPFKLNKVGVSVLSSLYHEYLRHSMLPI